MRSAAGEGEGEGGGGGGRKTLKKKLLSGFWLLCYVFVMLSCCVTLLRQSLKKNCIRAHLETIKRKLKEIESQAQTLFKKAINKVDSEIYGLNLDYDSQKKEDEQEAQKKIEREQQEKQEQTKLKEQNLRKQIYESDIPQQEKVTTFTYFLQQQNETLQQEYDTKEEESNESISNAASYGRTEFSKIDFGLWQHFLNDLRESSGQTQTQVESIACGLFLKILTYSQLEIQQSKVVLDVTANDFKEKEFIDITYLIQEINNVLMNRKFTLDTLVFVDIFKTTNIRPLQFQSIINTNIKKIEKQHMFLDLLTEWKKAWMSLNLYEIEAARLEDENTKQGFDKIKSGSSRRTNKPKKATRKINKQRPSDRV